MAQKNILFITPVLPSLNGRGRNYRAFQWVWRLQKKYQVSVLCTSIYGAQDSANDESIKQLDCKIYSSDHTYSTFQRLRNLLSLKPSTWNAVGNIIKKETEQLEMPRPDAILCFRIQNASTALYLKKFWKTPEIWLDIDEVDSKVKFNIAQRMRSEGYFYKSFKEWMEGVFYSFQESRMIPEFDKIFTSTKKEDKHLKNLNAAKKTEIFRNMLPAVDDETSIQIGTERFKFMFVGDSNYFPNFDAINFLLFDIIPGLKKAAQFPFSFIIIGGDVGNKQLHEIEKYNSIEYYRDVDNLKSVYDQVNAVIVPLRVGGGSSLKLLEAFKYRKPVISSTVGVRGYNVKNGVQALIGNDSSTLIEYCNQLMENNELVQLLSENGYRWFHQNNSYNINIKEAVPGG